MSRWRQDRPNECCRIGVGFETFEEFVKDSKPLEMAFSGFPKAAKISITLPVSTAGCERSFSKLKLIKNHLRMTMANARLAVISIHRKRALSIDLGLVVLGDVLTWGRFDR